MKTRSAFGTSRGWVVKIGSSLLTAGGRGLDLVGIDGWVSQIAHLHAEGRRMVLVSSGAVAAGVQRLGWTERPSSLARLQAAAAVGQMGLIETYEASFRRHGLRTAQILLTHDELANRVRYLNARSTLTTLLELGVVPIVNENDTVATDEIRFGDNDTLGALVTNLVEADLLAILTDRQGLFDADPQTNPQAQLVDEANADDPRLEAMASPKGGLLGRGGMYTKVKAAARAARSGAATVIADGREPRVLERIARGEQIGTLLRPSQEPLAARKRWLAGQLHVSGQLHLDQGAVARLVERGSSLLSVGVRDVEGSFDRGAIVGCRDPQGREIARGLVNYSAVETLRIKGQSSQRIETILGYVAEPELIHRDNLVIL